MKRICGLLLALLLLRCTIPAFAAQNDTLQELYDDSGIAEAAKVLDADTLSMLTAVGIDPEDAASLLDTDLSGLPKAIWELVCKQVKKPLGWFVSLLSVLLLAMILQGVSDPVKGHMPADILLLLACAGVLGTPMVQLVRQLSAVFETAGAFMEGFLPAYAGILLASGEGTGGYAMQTLTFGASVVITELMTKILLPVLSVCMALCFVCAANELIQTELLIKSISSSVGWTLGVAMSLFTIVLGVQRQIAQAADSLGLKTAKLAVSTLVPVVGGQLSDALSSVTTCLRLLRSSAGSFAILALTLLFLPAVLSLLSMLITLKLSETAAVLFRVEAAKRMFGSLAGCVGMLLGITLCAAAVMIIALTLLSTMMAA